MEQETSVEIQEPTFVRLPEWMAGSEVIWVSLAFLAWKLGVEKVVHSLTHSLSFRTGVDNEVYGVMWRLLSKVQCQRVILCQFHNGGHFNSGFPFLKLSTTHEVRQPGIASIKMTVQNMPTSFISEELQLLMAQDGYIFAQRSEKPGTCQSYLSSIGVETVAEVLIGTPAEPIGLLLCHWIEPTKDVEISLKDESLALASLLSRRLTVADVVRHLKAR